MKTHINNDETIGQYLLGTLSEEETERLDELSIADDEFAGRLNALENDLVDAYVRGELSGQTLERFNSFYLSSPRRSERVRFAKAFQNVADRTVVAAEKETWRRGSEGSTGEKRGSGPEWLRRFFFFPRPVLLWGAACAALLIVTVGLVVVNLRLRDQMDTAQAERAALEQRDREIQSQLAEERSAASSQQEKEIEGLRDKVAQLEQRAPEPGPSPLLPESPHIESFELSPQTRGVGQITLPVPADADYVVLQLELESGDYPSYRAALKSPPDRRVVWSSGRLRARSKDDRRVIDVGLRPSVLRSQTYILEVTGVSASGAQESVGSYSFRVNKK